MLRICSAETGEVHNVNATLRDIERVGNLELFINQEIGLDEGAVLAYLSDGQRLRTDNVRELAGAQDQMIFVFNKNYLDYDMDEVMKHLRVEPPLQPSIEDDISATPPYRPSVLASSYLRTAHAHIDALTRTFRSIQVQSQALRISADSLDLHVLSSSDAFESLASIAQRELDKQARLLAAVEGDLALISRVQIHREFLSPGARKAIENGDKERTLGDYVSNVKMRQVAETCRKTHAELQSRFTQAQQIMSRLQEGTDEVRDIVSNQSHLDEAEASAKHAQILSDKINEAAGALESPASDADTLLQELREYDSNLRSELTFIISAKNSYTQQCISALRRISVLNNDLVQLPPLLSSLQASFRQKNSFSHILRMHSMLYAYGATVIEVVRRKEFSKFFTQRAQSILEVMAKLSAEERKRRQVYRGDVHGQLPFDLKGMDNPVLMIDFSPIGQVDDMYSLERQDADSMMRLLDELEQFALTLDQATVDTVQETRAAVEKLVAKMDGLEAGFDRIAERSLLSSSRLLSSRRRTIEADEQAFQEMADQLREVQQSKAAQEAAFRDERARLQAEIARYRSLTEEFESGVSTDRERCDRLERDLHHARAQIEGDATARRVLESRHQELLNDVVSLRQSHAQALEDATRQTVTADRARQELEQVRTEAQAVKDLEARNKAKIASLIEEQEKALRNLEEARSRGEDLQMQIRAAREDSDQVHRALDEASADKDRLLKAQANEHERAMRDHLIEADSDRAVLQHHFSELNATLEHRTRELKEARAETEIARADALGLREELERVEHELREARHTERVLREDVKHGRVSQSAVEHREERSGRLVAEILAVAIAFRNAQVKALAAAHAMAAHPRDPKSPGALTDSVFNSGMSLSPLAGGFRRNVIGAHDEPSPIDPSDPAGALEILRGFDHDVFLEAIAKTGSTIRKWQKQCKEYRERAKGKISFRNFAKGDLALFLPTRNSVSKPWAAFNVSFPHYFLQASGHLADQLKTREWIVARITSITERIVDHNDPSSNPYGLGDGVKYYMLEVEDWTQPAPASKRKGRDRNTKGTSSSAEKDSLVTPSSAEALVPPPGPPEAEVEESFGVTRAPASHLFPVRQRSSSSPTAGPSALSRLLAQAPVDYALETIPGTPPSGARTPTVVPDREPSPALASSPPAPPSPETSAQPTSASSGGVPVPLPRGTSSRRGSVGQLPSPLRPGSRASRNSSLSRFSSPFAAAASSKAVATTALAPSPEGSPSDGLVSQVQQIQQHARRRVVSYHAPPSRASPLATLEGAPAATVGRGMTASGALSSLASSFGFGRNSKKRGSILPALEPPPAGAETGSADGDGDGDGDRGGDRAGEIVASPGSAAGGASAADILKRL